MTNTPAILKRLKLQEFTQPDIIPLKYPVFLCHGFGAIGSLVKPSPLHDPCMLMREHGVWAFAPNVVPYASIETRAKNWVRLINLVCDKYGLEKVSVVAHSMGGLDMRFALAHLDIAHRVTSLTTVASPHHGTYLADLILKTPEIITEKLSDVVDWFGNSVYPQEKSQVLSSVEQLCRNYIQKSFNPNTPNHPDIPYYSYSAAVGKGTEKSLNPVFLFQNAQIYSKEGVNDSFVSVESAKWGEHMGTLELSHMNQINVQVSKENKPVYNQFWTGILRMLKEQGF
ncbi:esterase/lipase family protein [Balneola vulgaris]|uniref:esterase/lipase family protein n=1 Tax=Balneola vulgaris TaxID=287535 RepID=UPI00035CB0FD|nr:alpha/beta fold hydrolase [Balneola vulgaris]